MHKQIIALGILVLVAGLLAIGAAAAPNQTAAAGDFDSVVALASSDGAACAGLLEEAYGNGDFLGTAGQPVATCCGGTTAAADDDVIASVAADGAACAGVALAGADNSDTLGTAGDALAACCGGAVVQAEPGEACEDDGCVDGISCITGDVASY